MPPQSQQPRENQKEHPLESVWTFWFKHPAAGDRSTAYELFLHALGRFKSLEEFWRFYSHIARPPHIPEHCQLACFRKDSRPMWEQFPEGGQVMLRIRKKCYTSRLWEDLLFGAVGEEFSEPEVVGVSLSIRPKEDSLGVWLSSMAKPLVSRVVEKFRQVLNLDQSVALDIKYNTQQLSSPSKSPAMTPVAGPVHTIAGMPPPLPSIAAAAHPGPLAHALSTGIGVPAPMPPVPTSSILDAAKAPEEPAKPAGEPAAEPAKP